MKKILLFVWDKIVGHLISILVATIFTTSFVLEVFTKIKPLTRLVFPFLMSRWSGWTVLTIVIVTLWIRSEIIKRRINTQGIILKPPEYHASFDRRVEERELGGVIWKIFVGSNVDPSTTKLSRESVFVWPFPHAYCPECDYELERRKTNWHCMPCRKDYKVPGELQENTLEKIRRNYERLVVQWGYNNFGIAEDGHKPFRVMLREMKKKQEKIEKQ